MPSTFRVETTNARAVKKSWNAEEMQGYRDEDDRTDDKNDDGESSDDRVVIVDLYNKQLYTEHAIELWCFCSL